MNLFGYHGKALRQRVCLHDESPGQGADQEGGDDGGDQPAEPPLLRLPGLHAPRAAGVHKVVQQPTPELRVLRDLMIIKWEVYKLQ